MSDESSSDDDAIEVKRCDDLSGVLDSCVNRIWKELEKTQYHLSTDDEHTKAAIAALMRAEDDLSNLEMHTLPISVFEKMVECRWNRKHCGRTYERRHSEAREIYAEARRAERQTCEARECCANTMSKK